MKKLTFIIVALIAIGLVWYKASLRPVDANAQVREVIEIPKGASVTKISEILSERNLIRSPSAFRLYSRMHGKQSALQAGSFVLSSSMKVEEIVEILGGKLSDQAIITIPEGFTVKDIDALLAQRGLIKAGDLVRCVNETSSDADPRLKSGANGERCDFSDYRFLPDAQGLAPRGGRLEGYLFPDTYFIVADQFTAQAFAKRLLDTFQQRIVDNAEIKEALTASKRTLYEIVTMASLIEEEAKTDEERPVVAGILWKRFDAEMGLGVDATVRYVLEKQTGALSTADLNVDSAYNLRKFRGLPPGPIASPGVKSIEAALKPTATDYWYYLHGTDGKIHYAVTNEEHNTNKFKYIR